MNAVMFLRLGEWVGEGPLCLVIGWGGVSMLDEWVGMRSSSHYACLQDGKRLLSSLGS